ncbi:hypothetical protein N7467_008057 [Penicillium canescens]|nr:hypothetical protein N7467_008057 [Penicillium canescens]
MGTTIVAFIARKSSAGPLGNPKTIELLHKSLEITYQVYEKKWGPVESPHFYQLIFQSNRPNPVYKLFEQLFDEAAKSGKPVILVLTGYDAYSTIAEGWKRMHERAPHVDCTIRVYLSSTETWEDDRRRMGYIHLDI